MIARAVAGAVPERQAACALPFDLPAEPDDLRRSRIVLHLGIKADDLPAARRERVVVLDVVGAPLAPVDVVATGVALPVVVTGGRRGPAGDLSVDRVVVPRKLFGRAPLVDVAQVEQAVQL